LAGRAMERSGSMLSFGDVGEELVIAGEGARQGDDLSVALLEHRDGLPVAEGFGCGLRIAYRLADLRGRSVGGVGEDVEDRVFGACRDRVGVGVPLIAGSKIVDGADTEFRERVGGVTIQRAE